MLPVLAHIPGDNLSAQNLLADDAHRDADDLPDAMVMMEMMLMLMMEMMLLIFLSAQLSCQADFTRQLIHF